MYLKCLFKLEDFETAEFKIFTQKGCTLPISVEKLFVVWKPPLSEENIILFIFKLLKFCYCCPTYIRT